MARYYRNGGVSSPLGGALSLPIGANRQAFSPLAPDDDDVYYYICERLKHHHQARRGDGKMGVCTVRLRGIETE